MTEEITPKTLDLAGALSGRTYATDETNVYLDEESAYEVYHLNNQIQRATVAEDKEALLQGEARLKELTKKAEPSRLTFHVTTAPRYVRKAVLDSVTEEFPVQYDIMGRPITSPESDEVYANRIWAVHIRKIVGADGSERVQPDEADIKVFRDNAPDLAIATVEAKIKELTEGAQSGVETLLQEHSFLSQP